MSIKPIKCPIRRKILNMEKDKSVNTVITDWIVEATSNHNDGYTKEYYMAQLRDVYKRLKELHFLN